MARHLGAAVALSYAVRAEDCDRLVKGGWRIYSSGPGLYLHKIMACLLGWRDSFGDIILDPVIAPGLDGLTARFTRAGKTVEVEYRVKKESHTPKSIAINGSPFTAFRTLDGVYRPSGVILSGADFDAALDRPVNRVQVDL